MRYGVTIVIEAYVYLMSLDLSKDRDPRAVIQFYVRGAKGLRKVTKKVGMGFKLFENSGGLDEYKNGYTINNIDGRENANCIEFVNGRRLTVGGVMGAVSEEHLRRLQIRETIESHLRRERQLFHKGIKVLSLFFIDEVDHYKQSRCIAPAALPSGIRPDAPMRHFSGSAFFPPWGTSP